MHDGASPYVAPRLTLRVGVVGHRPNKLGTIDPAVLGDRARKILDSLSRIVHALHASPEAAKAFAPAPPELRLATAVAEGADRIVAEAAKQSGYRLNLILPFRREIYAQDFAGPALAEFHAFDRDPVATCTELDVSAEAGDEDAYLAGGHAMLAHSDVVIAIWDGEPAAGRGGTADIVEEAKQRGLIVIVITLEGAIELWKAGDPADRPLAAGAWEPVGGGGLDAALGERLHGALSLPAGSGKGPGPQDCLDRFRGERLHTHTRASGYAVLRAVFDRRKPPYRVDCRLKEKRDGAWIETLDAARQIGGEEFRDAVTASLRERWIAADNLAIYYSHKYRTAFVANFSLAALAVVVGLATLFAPGSSGFKAILVILELACIFAILWITHQGRSQQWHDRWLTYRGVAEALRPARLPVLIGSSPARPGGDLDATPAQAWAAWYVRAALREIAPPNGVIGAEALRKAVNVAVSEEIGGQIRYHDDNAHSLHRLDHGLETAAEYALWGTIASGALYLTMFGVGQLSTWIYALTKCYKPVATFLGGTLPVLGAAIFGIRATGDFRSAVQQSERMLKALPRLSDKLRKAQPAPDRAEVEQLFGQVSRIMSDDLRLWEMVYSQRELGPGF